MSQIFLFNFLPYSGTIIRTLAKSKSALPLTALCLMLHTVTDPLIKHASIEGFGVICVLIHTILWE